MSLKLGIATPEAAGQGHTLMCTAVEGPEDEKTQPRAAAGPSQWGPGTLEFSYSMR